MTATADHDRPLISVVIPYGDARARPGHLATWTRKQTLPGERFEVIVLTGPLTPADRAALSRHLREQDRLLSHPAFEQFRMYALGAEAARGSVLFFTEDHCLADPGCLEAVDRYFETPGAEAASARWGSINENDISRVEELVNDRNIPLWFEQEHWNRVRIRGFAIRRDVYRAVGGFPGRYLHFDEAVLAARLHAAGYRVGFIRESGVRHINQTTFGVIRESASAYTWGECAFTDGNDPEFSEHYFQAGSILLQASPSRGEEIRPLLKALGASPRGTPGRGAVARWRAKAALAGQLFAEVARFTGGAAWGRLRARWGLLGARARFARPWATLEYRLRAFSDYWEGVVHLARLDYLSKHPRPAPAPLPVPPSGADFSAGQLPCRYPLEHHNGLAFRWTAPVETFRFRLEGDAYRLEIDTGGLRGSAGGLPLWLLWNGRPVRQEEIRRAGGLVAFDLSADRSVAGGDQRLDVVIPALRVVGTRERRRLGLPITSLRFVQPAPNQAGG